ncbi:MAG: hypothetical protein Q9181_006723 [Wetmoreana brouardii]
MAEPEDISFTYVLQDDVENINAYKADGYHPVKLDDEFCNGRYRVVHKLGFGSYSTVWMAKDRQQDKYVALKIISAQGSVSSNESRILRLLEQHRAAKPHSLGSNHVSHLLDEFDFDGPNGRHRCLVSDLAGYSVRHSKGCSIVWLFPLQAARAIAAQVIMGVHFLHSSGVVHGDLHTANIMLKVPNIENLSVNDLYQQFNPPIKQIVEREDGAPLDATVPPYAVVSLNTAQKCEDVTDPNTIITDFGEAYAAGAESRPFLNTPRHLVPPEALLHSGHIGMPADIWTLACTLVEIIGTKMLFEYYFFCDEDDVMAEIVSALGKPPDSCWKAWNKRHEFFLEDGTWSIGPERDHDGESIPLESRLDNRTRKYGEEFTQDEKDAFLQMLRGMLTYESQDRWRIEDVVRSMWMEKYGKPAVEALANEAKRNQSPEDETTQVPTENLAESCRDLSLSPKDSSDDFEKAASDAPNPATAPSDSFGPAPRSVSLPQENPESGDNHSGNPTEVAADAQESPESTQIPARSSSPISRFFDSVFRNGKKPSQDQENASKPSADPSKGYQTSNSPQSDSTAIPEIVIHGIESSDKDTTGDDGSRRQEKVEEGKAEDPDTESTS